MSDIVGGDEGSGLRLAEPLLNASAAASATDNGAVRASGGLGYRAAKRAVDLVLAAVGLILFSPILLAAALAIRLDSPGPALFKQERVGAGGKIFKLYKFRGMYSDARERFPELYAYRYTPEELTSLRFHPDRDPRVTRVGRFLRKTSVDELPNLINVLLGQMSIVGPRPEIPEMMPYYGEAKEIVLSVKPGVTSPAKAFGRDELPFMSTLEMDLRYVRERSIRLDLKIIAATAVAVIRQEGVV